MLKSPLNLKFYVQNAMPSVFSLRPSPLYCLHIRIEHRRIDRKG